MKFTQFLTKVHLQIFAWNSDLFPGMFTEFKNISGMVKKLRKLISLSKKWNFLEIHVRVDRSVSVQCTCKICVHWIVLVPLVVSQRFINWIQICTMPLVTLTRCESQIGEWWPVIDLFGNKTNNERHHTDSSSHYHIAVVQTKVTICPVPGLYNCYFNW